MKVALILLLVAVYGANSRRPGGRGRKAGMKKRVCDQVCGKEENQTFNIGRKVINADSEVCASDGNTYTVCELCKVDVKFSRMGNCDDKKEKSGKGGRKGKKPTKEDIKARLCKKACKAKKMKVVNREVCGDDGESHQLCDLCDKDVFAVHPGKCGVCTKDNVCPWMKIKNKKKMTMFMKNKRKHMRYGKCMFDCDFQIEKCKQFKESSTIKECENKKKESED